MCGHVSLPESFTELGLISALTSLAEVLAAAITWECESTGTSVCFCSHALSSCLHVMSPFSLAISAC